MIRVLYLVLLFTLLLGCNCSAKQSNNLHPLATTTQSLPPPPPAVNVNYYLTPSDCYHGQPSAFWPLLIMQPTAHSYELPLAPWGVGFPRVIKLLTPQTDCWLMLSDYKADTWQMELVKKGTEYKLDLSYRYRSENDLTYITLWPVDRAAACELWIEYDAPENYIYATVEPLGCDQIAKNEPFIVTFWGANLRSVSDCFVFWGFYAEDGGYGGFYADAHPDYPIGLYDSGKRNQGVEDREDFTADSVYALAGCPVAGYQGNMRSLMEICLADLREGGRIKAVRYDHLRRQEINIAQKAAVYASGVVTWQREPVPLVGHSGALFNTVLTISKPGNYALWFQHYTPAEYAQFMRFGNPEDAPTGPPVFFRVHDTPG